MNNEQRKICRAVDFFAEKMKTTMLGKYEDGYREWDCDDYTDIIRHKLTKNLMEDDFVDVANFAMMLDGFKVKRPGQND